MPQLPCEKIAPFIREEYSERDLRALRDVLAPATRVRLTPEGFLQAANRSDEGEDPTHYDAVWVRDSMWAYLALHSQNKTEALRVLKGMLRYFNSREQLSRLNRIVENPALAQDPMNVLHIRFDGRSPVMDDVRVQGKPQPWNHKQNDALGLFYGCAIEAIDSGLLVPEEAEWEALLKLPDYFEAVAFYEMEDAGAWEEIERLNTSSVGLVTWSLELAVKSPVLGPRLDTAKLSSLICAGYETVLKQLPFESPGYPSVSPKYREADAALLNLFYPARLEKIPTEALVAAIETIETLVGERGVLRYRGDAYQSGNYWLTPSPSSELDERTADCSGDEAFQKRSARMIPGTEAQWFFDSWLSKAHGVLFRETGDARHKRSQIHFFNRSLAQLTPPGPGADGKPVPPFSFPESWNTLVRGKERTFAPSPITPLNWAKCSMLLALDELELTVRQV